MYYAEAYAAGVKAAKEYGTGFDRDGDLMLIPQTPFPPSDKRMASYRKGWFAQLKRVRHFLRR